MDEYMLIVCFWECGGNARVGKFYRSSWWAYPFSWAICFRGAQNKSCV